MSAARSILGNKFIIQALEQNNLFFATDLKSCLAFCMCDILVQRNIEGCESCSDLCSSPTAKLFQLIVYLCFSKEGVGEAYIHGKNLYFRGFIDHIFNRFQKVSIVCLLYTSPSPRDRTRSRMPSSA